MAENPVKRPVEYDLKALLDLMKIEVLLSTNCHHLGTIQKFESAGRQTVQATVDYKRKINGQLQDYPVLIDCPLIVLGGGDGALTFPVKVGDKCMLFFNDRDIDNWFQGQDNGEIATNRLHSFTDAIALVGPRNLVNALADYDTVRTVLRHGDTALKLGTKINLKNASKDLKTVLEGGADLTTNLQTALTTFATGLTVGTLVAKAAALVAAISLLNTGVTTYKTGEIGGLLE